MTAEPHTTAGTDGVVAEKVATIQFMTEPADGIPPVSATPDDVAASAARLRAGTGPVAVDAERAGGYRYGNRAYLIQLRRTGSGTVLIDPIATPALTEIADAINDAEWILHAASQDLECLADVGLSPRSVFDTEVAARILGKPKVGLAAIAETELGISLRKAHSAADWSRRPLPEDWLRYAALDVELLVDLRETLGSQLVSCGRWPWAVEEFEYVRTMPPRPPRTEPWRRTSGIHRVRTQRGLAIAAALWHARDDLAQRRDTAPGRVLPDAAIAAAASAIPKSRSALAELPEFSGRGTRRRIDYWWEAVDAGLSLPDDQLPITSTPASGPPPPRAWPDRNPAAAARLATAKAGLSTLHDDLGIPIENLLTPDTVRRLCWDPPEIPKPETVTAALRAAGARQWQIDLTLDILVTALTASPTDAASGAPEASRQHPPA